MAMRRRVWLTVFTCAFLVALTPAALADENQSLQFGSFLHGLPHPDLGLDHILATVSVGIFSAFIGGRAIWTVPATFVVSMAVGGLAGNSELGVGSRLVELAIALSVVAPGPVILLDRKLSISLAMGAVDGSDDVVFTGR